MTIEPSAPTAKFIFIVCQNGAEAAARKEITQAHPNLRLAFSRPGFVTFKVDPEAPLPEKFVLRSTLARTAGWSNLKLHGQDAGELVRQVLDSNDLSSIDQIHVWQRDVMIPGSKGFEPGVSALAAEIGAQFEQRLAAIDRPIPINRIAKADDKILDVILVEPDQWWTGYHFATTVQGRWPGGVPMFGTDQETISRAYWKAKEAILWSGITIQAGDVCAEIGSAPGGCCQLLLELGARVIGIDPAEMQPELLENQNFTHIRRRGHEVRKKDLKDVKWLFADLNIVPKYTLDTISDIVANANVHVKGLILTLKLSDWKMIEQVPELIQRVRELGFSVVKSRQLAFNRREFCLVGVRDKFVLRQGKKSNTKADKSAPGKSIQESAPVERTLPANP